MSAKFGVFITKHKVHNALEFFSNAAPLLLKEENSWQRSRDFYLPLERDSVFHLPKGDNSSYKFGLFHLPKGENS
jgi:hypothetical protein